MLRTTYNLNFKSLLIFGKHTRNCRHKSWSLHLFGSVLKISSIRAKWLMSQMTFLSFSAYQLSAWHQESTSSFWEVFYKTGGFFLFFRCGENNIVIHLGVLFWPWLRLTVYRKHSFTTKQLCIFNQKKHPMGCFQFFYHPFVLRADHLLQRLRGFFRPNMKYF